MGITWTAQDGELPQRLRSTFNRIFGPHDTLEIHPASPPVASTWVESNSQVALAITQVRKQAQRLLSVCYPVGCNHFLVARGSGVCW